MTAPARAPRTPRNVRRWLAFYDAPWRYAHASWPQAILAGLAAMTDCPAPPPPPDAPILACLDPRRIRRFVAVLDVVLARAASDAASDASADAIADDTSPLRVDERAWVRASAPLLFPPDVAAGYAVDASDGAGCLKRYYAAQAPAIAARLRLLLPYDGVPPACPARSCGSVVDIDIDVSPEDARHGRPPRDACAERRFLERVWRWGERQCFW